MLFQDGAQRRVLPGLAASTVFGTRVHVEGKAPAPDRALTDEHVAGPVCASGALAPPPQIAPWMQDTSPK